jgi:aryl-alcohol dehydrogenase-like predicted oxidoreductase
MTMKARADSIRPYIQARKRKTNMDQNETLIQLGKTDIQVPRLGTGAWAWGDKSFWNYGAGYSEADIRAVFEACMAAGVNFFDTAELYGNGRSERFLGSFMLGASEPVVVATKFFPFPWRLTGSALPRALRGSLQRLNLQRVDLYQIHWPTPLMAIESLADELGKVVQQGLARAVGVSNYDEQQMGRASAALAKRGVPLASNQVVYSLINREVEKNGLLKSCLEQGITLIAYSPLGQGILTGKYSPKRPLPGVRGMRYPKSLLEKIQPLLSLMEGIGQAHEGKSKAQVALNWVICKGALPIPGAKNLRQVQENLGALGWRLTEAEMAALDEASDNH